MVLKFEFPIPDKKEKDVVDLERQGNEWIVKTKGKDIRVAYDAKAFSRLHRDHYKAILLPDEASAEVILFADLHCHTDNSLLDGMTRVPQLVSKIEYAGAITDHGNMYGYCEFYKGMKEAGKKPIIGVEVYTYSLDETKTGRHLILLAKNNTGYHNLLKLVSESHDHFYRHPHVTWDMLEKRHEGIIACAACIGGVIQRYVTESKFKEAEDAIQRYISIFGKEDFYLEVQRHGIPQEGMVEAFFQDMAEKYRLKIIATTDAHYPTAKDAYPHEILLCIQQGKTINEQHWTFEGSGYYLHSSAEMEELFHDHPEWLDNTLDLADKCEVEIELGHVNLPKYEVPTPFESSDAYFEHLCWEGFQARFANTPHLTDETYLKRFDYELNMIKQMKFSGYFLIVWDYINWSRNHDIYVGPGRGSAAGSLLAYCVGITDIDPLKYGLLFERFLNPERVSMPD